MSKKIIALLLVFVMVAAVVSVSIVSAGAATGTTWYVRGTFTNWEAKSDYLMTYDSATETYVLSGVEISAGQEFKVADANWGESFPSNNYKVTEAGTYTITFDADSNTVTATAESTVETIWYVRGSFNNWAADENSMMTDEDNDGIYQLSDVAIEANGEFKVAANGGWDVAYPSSNYVVTEAGTYTILFDTNTFTVSLEGVESQTITVYYKNTENWDDVSVYYWGGNSGVDWPGVATTYVCSDGDGNKIYKAVVPDGVTGIIFNNGDTNDMKQTDNITSNIVDVALFDFNRNFESNPTVVKGYSVSLTDEIGVNFYVNGTATEATYSYGDEEANYSVSDTVEPKADGTYAAMKFSIPVNARSMTDDITLTVKDGEDVIMTATYRVVDYAESLAAAYPDYVDLMCYMLKYGGSVQEYFGYNTTDSADSYINTVQSGWNKENADPSGTVGTITADSFATQGLTFKSSSILVTGTTVIRLYFTSDTVTDAADLPAATCNGKDLSWEKSGSRFYLDISLVVKDIFASQEIKIGDTSATYNAISYYNFAKGNTTYPKLESVIVAMYNYYAAAAAIIN